uniref:NADH-ubiquinone oxidoreductase chain 6 n=1 Tax=Stylosomus rugithorax TaxID=1425630 RepID=A0A3G1GQ50_9CUCU|nr:NADH dehydrogenase subunit 6 [Stylosomus rugithorax]
MIMTFIFINSIMFCLMNHPLSLGMVMFIQAILVSVLTGKLCANFWYSYIIFIIMIGGLLVLFMYMTSVASNEKFKFSKKIIGLIIWCTPPLFLTLILEEPLVLDLKFKMNEMAPAESINQFISLSKYINPPHMMIYMMMIIYLLITLIAIVKIMSQSKGSLRQKF